MAEVISTDSYSETHKLALYYQELQASNPAWRPGCPDCRAARRGVRLMIKNTGGGFYCLLCKLTLNYSMKKVEDNGTQTSRDLSRTTQPTSRPRAGD